MNKLYNFSVSVYGDLQPKTQTTSIGRCRIFYKGLNRNGAFITDAFAEKLLSTLPYTPVKGIYSEEDNDYGKHGKVNSEGKIYGVVPENPNVSWEQHLDEDGVSRLYACCDVLLYTALYREASEIFFKQESMELYPPSIKGMWKMYNGKRVYEYSDACFFGLQVLGDSIDPCFEGAAFYTLNDKIENVFEKLNTLSNSLKEYKLGGNVEMPKMNFKLSDCDVEVFQQLFSLLNPNFTEEGNWEIDCIICDIAEEYAIIKNYENNVYEKVMFSKTETEEEDGEDEEGNKKFKKKTNCELGEKTEYSILSATSEEIESLKTVQELNGGSFEKIDEVFSKIPELEAKVAEIEEQNSNFEQKILEKDSTITTLNTEKNEISEKFTSISTELENTKTELNSLKEFKLTIETAKKQSIIDKYSAQLDNEIISKYSASDEIGIDELEKQLAFELVKATPSLFSREDEKNNGYVPAETIPPTGIEAILNKYKK